MRNFIITIDGKQYQVGVEEVGEGATNQPVIQNIAPIAAQAATQEAKASATTQTVNGEKVLSPFPGLIKKLLVTEGATVKKDQAILVLEAMKMDNDITAPCAGKVSFSVQSGANVETNTLLAVIS